MLISVVIFLLKKHLKSGALYHSIVTSLRLHLVTDGYIDSSSAIISSNIHYTVKQAQSQRKLKKI
jgi:hypothetical protein